MEHQPNLALKELQTELCEVCGMETLVQTIVCTLQREGYTMKTVCYFVCFGLHSDTHFNCVDNAACSGAK